MTQIPRYASAQVTAEAPTSFDVTDIQDRIKTVLDDVSRRPHMSGELLENTDVTTDLITLTTGVENLIETGLDGPVRGWYIVDMTTGALVNRIASPTSNAYDADRHLALNTSVTTTVRIVVF